MGQLFDLVKKRIERATGARIYRHSLPHGSDLFWDLRRLPRWAPEARVIFDVGAHVGGTVARFREAFPAATIYAFEPAPQNRKILTDSFGTDPRVRIQPFAVSAAEGVATLHLSGHSTKHSLVHRDAALATEQVRTVTLDSFCTEQRIPHIHFCKIDTEGHDLDVLRGASGLLENQRIDLVQVETSFRRDTKYFSPAWEIDRFMAEKRYEVFGFYEQQPCWTGRNSLLFINAVYIRTSLVEDVPPE